MNSEGHRRSILVPIDLYGVNLAALETLVRIARQLDRKLLGLLLEDIRLQQVADLPFTTEISISNAQEKSLLRDHLSQRHSLISTQTRRRLNELASSNQVELSFEDAAGARLPTVLERAGHLDIFLPARQRWHASPPRVPGRQNPIRRLGVVLGETPVNSTVIDTAAALVQADLAGDVYLLVKNSPLPEQLHALYRLGHQVRLQLDFTPTPQNLTALILRSPYDLLLLPREVLRDIPQAELEAALDRAGGQVLIIN